MLTVIRDELGTLQAACDWLLVDAQGRHDPLHGTYVWVEQLELSPNLHSAALIRQIVLQIASQVPWADAAYWVRRDHPGRIMQTYRRSQLLREGVRVQ